MCGIAGFVTRNKNCKIQNELEKMANCIINRGPDDSGFWQDEQLGIGLAHRRLSILDISQSGHQPMSSNSGRFIIIFNGEIYNHLDIRTKIENLNKTHKWIGHSDTETILSSIETFGIEVTIQMLVGMFSIAIWDKQLEEMTLCRDRAGEKPLYYGLIENTFYFASELKSIAANSFFKKDIDKKSLGQYFKYGYVPCPSSIYKGINKLKPGCLIRFKLATFNFTEVTYWSLNTVIESRRIQTSTVSSQIDQLDFLLNQSVKGQMLSDVPLGAFLSGGVDSSLIVAIMQNQSSKPIKTFTIGFEDQKFNEAIYAKNIAHHLGTEHNELYLSSKDALNVVPEISSIYDEPFSDSSQIPTFLVSKLAKEKVTVALSGDGGDELFAGYNRYLLTNQTWNKISLLPKSFRVQLAKMMRLIDSENWDQLYKLFSWTIPKVKRMNNFGDKISKASFVIGSNNPEELYDRLVSTWQDSDNPVFSFSADHLNDFSLHSNINVVEKMMAKDFLNYLPDDILVKVDRAAMSNSLETRVPFLDHRVIEFAWNISIENKLNSNVGKLILRSVLDKYVPRNLIERPKMGFGVPIGEWLKGPLKSWGESLISKDIIENAGLLDYNEIKNKWEEHQSGKRNWQYQLWSVLMFQDWYLKQYLN